MLRSVGGLSNAELAETFDDWNQGELQSYLIEITAHIFRAKDPDTGGDLIDLILDAGVHEGNRAVDRTGRRRAGRAGADDRGVGRGARAVVRPRGAARDVGAAARPLPHRAVAVGPQGVRRRRARRALRGEGVRLRAGHEPAARRVARAQLEPATSPSWRASGRPAASSARSSSAASRPPTSASRACPTCCSIPSSRRSWPRARARGGGSSGARRRAACRCSRRRRRSATTTASGASACPRT